MVVHCCYLTMIFWSLDVPLKFMPTHLSEPFPLQKQLRVWPPFEIKLLGSSLLRSSKLSGWNLRWQPVMAHPPDLRDSVKLCNIYCFSIFYFTIYTIYAMKRDPGPENPSSFPTAQATPLFQHTHRLGRGMVSEVRCRVIHKQHDILEGAR